MRTRPTIRALAVALVLLALAVCPALGDELPQWPNEQQAMLRNVEGQVLQVQSQLFAARQTNDRTAIEELSKKFKALQDKRRVLIGLTANQLPSE